MTDRAAASRETATYHRKYYEELFTYTVPFWLEHGPDPLNGGWYTCLDRRGEVFSDDRSVRMTARAAWTFSNLCNVYGRREEWLTQAETCLKFLREHCVDPADGRMYFSVTGDGRPLRKRRYYFCEIFYILANAEYYEATGDTQAQETARRYYDLVWTIYGDPDADPWKVTPKYFAENRNFRAFGTSMILLHVNAQMRRCDPRRWEEYDRRAKILLHVMLDYHYKPELECVLESVGKNGEFISDVSAGRVINPGHGFEVSWFLAEEARYFKNGELLQKAIRIYDCSMRWGWDREYGGILYFVDVLGKPPEPYEHDMKLWWPACEALISALTLYGETGEERFFKDFQKLTDYCFAAFSDHEYGEWYGYLRRDGKPTVPPLKGGMYKGFYHVARMLIKNEQMLERMVRYGTET